MILTLSVQPITVPYTERARKSGPIITAIQQVATMTFILQTSRLYTSSSKILKYKEHSILNFKLYQQTKMSPLAPLLHSQHRHDVQINENTESLCLGGILLVFAVILFLCCVQRRPRPVQKAAFIEHLPRGTKLYTLDGREIVIP